MKKIVKYYLKNSDLVFNILVRIVYFYLKLAYFTSKWEFVSKAGFDQIADNKAEGVLFAIWHDKLAYSMHIFKNYKPNMYGLTSPHSDGKIIAKLALMMGYGIIEGSSNKNSSAAVKEIITHLNQNHGILVTPDGPRGPRHKNGSIITKIANKYNKKLVPLSCFASNYFTLNSWDQMTIPKPFGKITVIIGNPLELTQDEEYNKLMLENALNSLAVPSKVRFQSRNQ